MEKEPQNPFAQKDGSPRKGKYIQWHQWEFEHQTHLKEIWRLPIDERRERAVVRQSVQRRWDAEAGNFYNDEEHDRRIQELMKLYKAI
ncbi:hypothetical protein [Spirosoma linguale]|uniref:Uncharacterized protein n=1 Tax=Spirosoma linguale (strain ATCC 33905 / DSM 74 / LMG 10896 / Claus 1) TaxID=504472 RepID=D2QUC8_SPILD|nr:hypothetical protein Slin_6453 [Spirosoma linguale DSM 74]